MQATGSTGRIGCGLSVVHGRLYVSGGVDEARNRGFDGSVARWTGTLGDLSCGQLEAGVSANEAGEVRQCAKSWTVVPGLELPTAMHAHTSITIPWLPKKR